MDRKSMDRKSVFISHALSDKEFARGITEQMREKGIDVYVDDASGVGSGCADRYHLMTADPGGGALNVA